MTWILASKLARPSSVPGWLPRGRLVAEATLPVVMLIAGPGTGKTLAMLSLVEAGSSPNALVLWYAMDESDADPVVFVQHLLAGMRHHIPDFARELDAWISGPDPDPKRVWSGFFAAIASYNLPRFVFALDDLHHLSLAQPAWVRAFATALERLPAGARVFITARRSDHLPLARMKARGQGVLFEARSLHFDAGEQAEYLQLRAGNGQVTPAWQERARGLDGWPLGLRLVSGEKTLPSAVSGPSDDLTAYVAEEMFHTQEPDLQAFMLRAAWLEEPTAAAATAILGDPEAARHLAHLTHEQLVMRLADGVTHRFPGYLRDMLREESKAVLSTVALSALHARAAGFHQGEGRHDLAVPHLLAAGDYEEACAACRRCFPGLASAGRYEPIERWLKAFPAPWAEKRGVLALWQGHVSYRHGENPPSLAAYERARRLFAAEDDDAGELKALVWQCTLLAHAEDAKRLRPLMMQALALLPQGEDIDRADFLLVRALLADQRGDLALVRECNAGILALQDAGPEVASARWIASINLHTLALHEGDFDAARRHVETAIAIAERHGFPAYALYAKFLRADMAIVIGQPEAASEFVRGLPQGWEEILEWQDRGVALAIVGHAHQARGEWREAEDRYARALALFERAEHKTGAKMVIERQARLAILRGQPERAIRLCRSVGELADNFYDLAIAVELAWATQLAGNALAVGADWQRLVATLDAHGARLLGARARLYEAAGLIATGQATPGALALANAIGHLEARGFGFLRQQEPALWAQTAAAEAVAIGTVALGTVALGTVAIAQADSPALPMLELRCFGSCEVRVEGRLLDVWPRRKAKRALAALALQSGVITAQDLAVAMGDGDDEGGLNSMRMALVALRRALEPTLGKGEESAYVRSTVAGYALASERVAFIDVQAFDTEIARARLLSREGGGTSVLAVAYEKALGYYRGNLLTESFFTGCFEAERHRLQRDALEALRHVHEGHLALGDRTGAEQLLQRAIALAPCEEEPYLLMMRLHKAVDRSERVRQVYWDYRKALKANMDTSPGPEFEAAYREIAGG